MSGFNYSKWDNIELSDDEDDLHPNIDKESWFRMKHRSRVEREDREDEEIKMIEKQNNEDNARMINFMRVDLDEVVKRAAEKQGNNSNIQTQVTNNVGGSSYSGGGNPSTGGNPNHAIVGLGWAG
jgi:cell division cycle protein 37